jgi:hypothetical protein
LLHRKNAGSLALGCIVLKLKGLSLDLRGITVLTMAHFVPAKAKKIALGVVMEDDLPHLHYYGAGNNLSRHARLPQFRLVGDVL